MKTLDSMVSELRKLVKSPKQSGDVFQHNKLTDTYRIEIAGTKVDIGWIAEDQAKAIVQRAIYLAGLDSWRRTLRDTHGERLTAIGEDPKKAWTYGAARIHSDIHIVASDGTLHTLPVFVPTGSTRKMHANNDDLRDIRAALRSTITSWIVVKPDSISDKWRSSTFYHPESDSVMHIEDTPVETVSALIEAFIESVSNYVNEELIKNEAERNAPLPETKDEGTT